MRPKTMSELQNHLDSLFGYTASVVEDIRSKLIDEGWFGRPTTETPGAAWIDSPVAEPNGLGAAEPAFEDLWATLPTIELEDVGDELTDIIADLGIDL